MKKLSTFDNLNSNEEQIFKDFLISWGEKEQRLQECVSEIQTVRFQSNSKLKECNELSALEIILSGFQCRQNVTCDRSFD